MPRTPLLSLPLLLLATTLHAQTPTLDWRGEGSVESAARVVTVTRLPGQQVTGLLPYIFFDAGSSTLPARYHRLASRGETPGFSEEALTGDAIEKHHHLLDVIGSRLHAHPALSITLQGCNSREPDSGETREVSAARAESVARYLAEVWGLDTGRVRVLPPRDLPMTPSNMKDPLGREENRRVEIGVDDPAGAGYAIMRPMVERSTRPFLSPTRIRFVMANGIEPVLVARRWIEIARDGGVIDTVHDLGITDNESMPWDLEEHRVGAIGSPLTAGLAVQMSDGVVLRSRPLEIPVRIVSPPGGVDDFTLILFEFDSPRAGQLNERIMRDLLLPAVTAGTGIQVTGRTDIDPYESRIRLTVMRAQTVVDMMKKGATAAYASMESRGAGADNPLYTNALPEGRFYNRSVTVRITR